MLSRLAISIASLSGDDDRSGDSGDDRGGVSNGSVPANAASTLLTMSLAPSIADLNMILRLTVSNLFGNPKNKLIFYRNSSTRGAGAK